MTAARLQGAGPDRIWKNLPARGVNEMVIAQGPHQVGAELGAHPRQLGYFACCGIVTEKNYVGIVAADAEPCRDLCDIRKGRRANQIGV